MRSPIHELKQTARNYCNTITGAYGLLTLMSLFLASNHVVGRSVQGVIPPLGLSFWRWFAGALILFPFIAPRLNRLLPLYRQHFAVHLLLGCLMVGSTTLILVALNFTTAINVSLVNAMQPTLTLMMAAIFIHERLTPLAMLGIFSALTGVVIMLSKASWALLSGLQFNIGDILALIAMLGLSAYSLNLKKLPNTLSVAESLFAIAFWGSLALLPFYLIETVAYAAIPVTETTALVVLQLALLVSVFGNLMWNQGNKVVGPSRAVVFMNLIPIFGTLLAVTFLGEQVRAYYLAGALLICLGIWLVVGKLGATPYNKTA